MGEKQRERGREKIPSRLHTASVEPISGLDPMNPEIMNPEPKLRVGRLRPGAPRMLILKQR